MSSRSTVLTQGLGSWGSRSLVVTLGFGAAIAPTTAAITGSILGATEADIRAGGKTIIITLSSDTWVAGAFNGQRQAIINGLNSSGSEVFGWTNVVRALQSITGVVRNSATQVTITLDAFPTYNITANETITVTVPSPALVTSLVAVVATPTFTISFIPDADGVRPSGGVPSRDLGDKGPTQEQIRKSRIRFGLIPEEVEVIESVALRQVEKLDLDEQQKLDELRGELQLKKIALESRHIQALNDERERLIDLEIASIFRQNQEEALLLLLMMSV